MTTSTQKPPMNELRQRQGIPEEHTWKLSDIYVSDESWESEIENIRALISKAPSYVGKLHTSPLVLFNCLEDRSTLSRKLHNHYQYAYLSKDLDNRVSKYQAMVQRASALSAEAGAAYSFVEPELLLLSESQLRSLCAKFPKTNVYDFFIDDLVRSKTHIRSTEIEEILALSAVVARGPDTIFSMFDDADIQYPTVKDEQGNEIALTKQRYQKLLESRDRRVRKVVNDGFYSPYRSHLNTLGASLGASVNKDVFYTKTRRYDSCLARALDSDNIPLSVYHALLDTTEANLDGLHRYVRLRKRLLRIPEICSYDMTCPLFPEKVIDIPYEDAVRQVIESASPLGSHYLNHLRKAFSSRWVDVYETDGKGGGAYNWGNYDAHPFVLMNYNGTVDAVFTLAHELGHAMHSTLANESQPFAKSHYSIFTAEVASTLNEGLLLKLLLNTSAEPEMRLILLNRQLDMTVQTFFNQVMYARFELLIHEEVERGGALSPETMTGWWRDLLGKYFGADFTLDEYSPLKWCRIPHFYNMFYVYQYATSYAASQAILKKISDKESGIVDKYLEMLSSGGSDYPIQLLKKCGIDMTTPTPVISTISEFSAQVSELESLTAKMLP